jgi:pimeloyl-ACP methyl ester carboxylesterase
MLAAGPCHALPVPQLVQADGVTLNWEQHGDGEGVLIAGLAYSYPETLRGLIDDLARDHRVVLPDLRGTGGSSRQGPYDMATDVGDLAAVLEQSGGVKVAIGLGDGTLRAVELAAARGDLVESVVLSGYAPLFRGERRETHGLAGSAEVLGALLTLLETDYRSAMRTIMETGNPDLDEPAIRERVDGVVAHCSHEAAIARLRNWIELDVGNSALALGDRLWILHHPRNPWFPAELAERIPALLPEARLERVADGAVSRPDLTAAVVRRITRDHS